VREISPRFPERTANNKEKFFRSQNPFFIIRATPPPPSSSREKSCCGLTNSAVKLATKAFSTLDNPSSVKIEFATVIKVNSLYPREKKFGFVAYKTHSSCQMLPTRNANFTRTQMA
jgi:hypothetical protein